jgi:hypothetical protein
MRLDLRLVGARNLTQNFCNSLETEYDMEVFYHPSNRALNEFVDRVSPLFEIKPQGTDYTVSFFRI